jgi:hypothetical protein
MTIAPKQPGKVSSEAETKRLQVIKFREDINLLFSSVPTMNKETFEKLKRVLLSIEDKELMFGVAMDFFKSSFYIEKNYIEINSKQAAAINEKRKDLLAPYSSLS